MNNKIDIHFYYHIPEYSDLPKYVQHIIDEEYYRVGFQRLLQTFTNASDLCMSHFINDEFSFIDTISILKHNENMFNEAVNTFKNNHDLKKVDFFKYVVKIK